MADYDDYCVDIRFRLKKTTAKMASLARAEILKMVDEYISQWKEGSLKELRPTRRDPIEWANYYEDFSPAPPRMIDLDKLLAYPLQGDNLDREHMPDGFEDGVKSVLEWAEQLWEEEGE